MYVCLQRKQRQKAFVLKRKSEILFHMSCQDIAEILLKLALNTNQSIYQYFI
jgi:hypothetical protein